MHTVRKHIGNLIRHKLRERRGLSLTELLVTIIFCLMTFALVVTAMDAAVRQLKKQTMYSESKLLCSTLAISVEDVLRYAGSGDKLLSASDASDKSVDVDADEAAALENLKFYSRKNNNRVQSDNCYFRITTEADNTTSSNGTIQNNSGHIVLMAQVSAKGSDAGTQDIVYELIPASGYTQGMKAKLKLKWHGSDNYKKTDKEYHTFTGTVYVTDKDDNELCSQDFTVRPINVNDVNDGS